MNEEFNEELISAYLDGELSNEEAARVEQAINSDPDLQEFADQSRLLGDDLRALPRFEISGSVADRAIRGAERSMLNDDLPVLSAKNNLRRWLIGLSSVCAAAIVLVIASFSFPTGENLLPVSMKRDEENRSHHADAESLAEGQQEQGIVDLEQNPKAAPLLSEVDDNVLQKGNSLADGQIHSPQDSQHGIANRARLQQPQADLIPASSPSANGESQPARPNAEVPSRPSSPAEPVDAEPVAVEPSAPAAPLPNPSIAPQEAVADAAMVRQKAPQFTAQLKIGPAALREKLAANETTKDLVLKMLGSKGAARNAKREKRATIEVTREQLAEIRKLLANEKITWKPMRVAAITVPASSAEDFPFSQANPEPLGNPQSFAPNVPKENRNAGSLPPAVTDSPNNNGVAKSVPADANAPITPSQSTANPNDADLAAASDANFKIRIYFVFDLPRVNDGIAADANAADANASEAPAVEPAGPDD